MMERLTLVELSPLGTLHHDKAVRKIRIPQASVLLSLMDKAKRALPPFTFTRKVNT